MKPATGNFYLDPQILDNAMMRRIQPRLAFDPSVSLKTWQGKLRRALKGAMGWSVADQPRGELKPRRQWRMNHQLGEIEKIVFRSAPGSDVPAYVCVPHTWREPRTWVICLQGHSSGMHNSIGMDYDEQKPIEADGDRDFALGAMARGCGALCIEQRGFGQRRLTGRSDKTTCVEPTMHALMLGTTIAAQRVYDVDRGIDLLEQRDDVDRRRIGVMGNSGGGTISIYAAALLKRIAFAMPSCSFCTYRDSIMSIHHCPDNFVPGLLRYAEASDVVGLIAPRPLVIVNGRDDDIFPIKPAKRAFSKVKQIYTAADAGRRCRHVIGEGGHRFYAAQAWQALDAAWGSR